MKLTTLPLDWTRHRIRLSAFAGMFATGALVGWIQLLISGFCSVSYPNARFIKDMAFHQPHFTTPAEYLAVLVLTLPWGLAVAWMLSRTIRSTPTSERAHFAMLLSAFIGWDAASRMMIFSFSIPGWC